MPCVLTFCSTSLRRAVRSATMWKCVCVSSFFFLQLFLAQSNQTGWWSADRERDERDRGTQRSSSAASRCPAVWDQPVVFQNDHDWHVIKTSFHQKSGNYETLVSYSHVANVQFIHQCSNHRFPLTIPRDCISGTIFPTRRLHRLLEDGLRDVGSCTWFFDTQQAWLS